MQARLTAYILDLMANGHFSGVLAKFLENQQSQKKLLHFRSVRTIQNRCSDVCKELATVPSDVDIPALH